MYWAPAIVGTTAQLLAVSLFILQNYQRHEAIDTDPHQLVDEYDYIVVGSGSAGAIVAHRLAEDRHTTVLLIEAGLPTDVTNDIPAQATTGLQFSSRYDWNYTMTPQKIGVGFKNHVIPETRGFAIGGTSSINTMIYNRGNRRDYDAWAHDYGAVGWSYDEVLPFFKKYEGNRDPHLVAQNQPFHGTDGPLAVTSWANPHPLLVKHEKILNAEANIPTTDINGANQVGTTIAQACQDTNGIRASSSNSYIDPNPFPHNLHIMSRTLVTKVLIKDKTAVGVLLERKGAGFRVMARKEVILSAGVHNSPQLLMLSGIGPAEHLQEMHIPLVKDLPVGDNFMNHPSLLFQLLVKPESATKFLNVMGSLTSGQMYEWFTNSPKGPGPLGSHHRAVTYFSTSSNKDKEWPNVGWETTFYRFPDNLTDIRNFRYHDQKAWDQFFTKNYLGRFYTFVHIILQRVRSRGYIRLASNNPHVAPIINPNFLQHPQDYEDSVEMIRKVLQFYELSSMAEHLIWPIVPIPGCYLCKDKRYLFECESYIRCAMEQVMYGSYHPVGGNRMGDPKRHDTVVDPNCRVKGINNLRVADNSIVPLLQNANTNAGALMIGEKCAHIIKSQSNYI